MPNLARECIATDDELATYMRAPEEDRTVFQGIIPIV